MANFFKNHKIEIILLSIWLIILNIYKVCFHVVGVDTEQALIELNSNLNWTLGSGRFASAFFRKLLMPIGFNYDLAVLYMIMGWLCVCLGYMYCFEKLGLKNRVINVFFGFIFVACPIWAEQNYFLCSVFVNVYGMLFTIIAAFLLVYFIENPVNVKKILLPIMLSVIAIGTYQALLYLLMANCIIFLSLRSYQKNEKISIYLLNGLKCIFICALSTLFYFFCSKVCSKVFYNPAIDYAGDINADKYISNFIGWFANDFEVCIENIKSYIASTYKTDYAYGIPGYPVLFAVIQLLFLYKLIIKKESQSGIALIGNLLLFICAFAGNIVLGNTIPVREQFVLPVFVAFNILILLYEANQIFFGWKDNYRKIVRLIIAVGCFYVVIIWGGKQLSINRSDYIRYVADVTYASDLMEEIKEREGSYTDKKIVLIGMNQWKLPDHYLKGDVIGTSVFSWDAGGPVGVNYRSYGMLNACGYSYIKPSIEEVQYIQNICEENDIFGEERIVIYDDYIVVNLNEF